MLPKLPKNKTTLIFLGLFLGFIVGLLMKLVPSSIYIDDIIVGGLFKLIGNGFINLIKMTVIPLVFISLVCGISSFGDTKKLGRVGGKTVLLFTVTTIIAIVIALFFATTLKPGIGINMSHLLSSEYTVPKSQGLIDTILNMIPTNPLQSMSEGNLLQILVFAVFLGIAIGSLGTKAQPIINAFNILNDCIMKIVDIIMMLAPFGVFALIANTVYSIGIDSLFSVLKMIGVVAICLLLQAFLVYGIMLKLTTNLPFNIFLKKYTPIASVAFSTSSSNATIPLSMRVMDELGVDKSIYQFSLPLGATVNMAGTAIMQGVAAVFIAQIYGINLSIYSMLTIVVTAVLASVGTAGVPGVGMVMMTMVLQSVNLPIEGMALIFGFDRILDMMRTPINVMGDCICTIIVANSEKSLDRDKYINN